MKTRSSAGVKAAGVGSPGTIDSKNGVIVYSNNIRWENVPLASEIEKELSEIQARLHELKIIGKVSVSGTVYAGVKIFIRDVKDEVRTDVKNVTFFYENGFVRRGKYEAPDTDVTKQVLNGFSST